MTNPILLRMGCKPCIDAQKFYKRIGFKGSHIGFKRDSR
jgi:hypothetical protein